MNYIREAENYLYHYGDLYRSIENMDKEISRLIRQAGPQDITGISYDSPIVSTSINQDETINTLFQIQTLTQSRKETAVKLKEIDKLLECVSKDEGCELYGKVLRQWYIESISKEDIAESLGYSSRQSVYDIRAKAIRKFAVQLFGINALKML